MSKLFNKLASLTISSVSIISKPSRPVILDSVPYRFSALSTDAVIVGILLASIVPVVELFNVIN